MLSSALAASAALGLAACTDDTAGGGSASSGGSDAGGGAPALEAVTISEDLATEPVVEFTAPLEVAEPDARTVVAGTGEAITEGATLIWRDLYVDAATGDTLQSWWQGAPAGGLTVSADTIGQAAYDFFLTATVGSRIALAGWQQDSSGQMRSLLQVADIDRIVSPLRAEGEEQPASGSFPPVTRAENGAPALSSPPVGDPPAATQREVLIQGSGPMTRPGDYLVMQYTGWKWSDGTQFDSSWDRGAPFGFVQGQGQVITGWDANLLDLPVGSQVLLAIPAADAYGAEPSEGNPLAGEALLFVVDILDAASTVSA